MVNRLAPDWQLRTEAEILLALFEVEEVTGEDLLNVRRSIWGSSEAAALEKLYAVMNHLTESGCLQEDSGEVFRVERGQAPSRSPLPSPSLESKRQGAGQKSASSDSDELVQ